MVFLSRVLFSLEVTANVQFAEQWRLCIDAHGSLFIPPYFFPYSRGLPFPKISSLSVYFFRNGFREFALWGEKSNPSYWGTQ